MLPHRLVMAPMTHNRAAADGTPTPLNPARDACVMYVGGAEGYTDYPALAAERPRRLSGPPTAATAR